LNHDPAQRPDPTAAAAGDRAGPIARLRSFWAVPTYRFAILFLALLTGMALAYPALRLRLGHQIRAFELFTAELVYEVLRLFSDKARLEGRGIVFFDHFPVAIIDECTGVYEAVLLSAALLAFPASWGKTAIGFLLGLPLIYALNLARIVLLLCVGRWLPGAFELMHVYFWQVTMIAMVSGLWLAWVIWVVRDDPGVRGQHRSPREGPEEGAGG
jgi:exosortase H (IPTLxxWG-CTERM-specific)